MFLTRARMRTIRGGAEGDRPPKIPTIGIGAGASVSGQVLVYQDVLGLNPGFRPKFLRSYADMFGMIQAGLNAYNRDVKQGSFPSESESYEGQPANLQIAKHAA